jgi:type I restriction enzyme S subunit
VARGESGLPHGWPLPPEWRIVPLRAVARLGTGHTPDRDRPEYWVDCNIPWVTTADITTRTDRDFAPLMETAQQISEVGLRNSAAVLHPVDTVMLSRTATIGEVVRIGRPMATTQAFATWSCGPSLDPRYLFVVMKALRPEFDRLAQGSTHRTIYMPAIKQISVPLPPLPEQRAIADYLDRETSRIDALIERKQRLIEVLREREEAARTLAVLTDASSVSYPRTRLKFLVPSIGVGLVINPSSYFAADGVPFLHGSHITEGGIHFDPPRYMARADSLALPSSRLHEGDVIVVRAGYPGRAVVVPAEYEGANCASVIVVRRSARILPAFLAEFLNSAEGARQVGLVQYGAAQEQINVGHIVDFWVPSPPVADQVRSLERIASECSPLIAARRRLSTQVGLFREVRQALITAAITGQLAIPEAA